MYDGRIEPSLFLESPVIVTKILLTFAEFTGTPQDVKGLPAGVLVSLVLINLVLINLALIMPGKLRYTLT